MLMLSQWNYAVNVLRLKTEEACGTWKRKRSGRNRNSVSFILHSQEIGMFDSLEEATHMKAESKSISTMNGGRCAITVGIQTMRKSFVDSLNLVPQYRPLEAHVSVRDPGGSYSMISLVLAASRRSSYVHIGEWGQTIVVIPKTRALCAVQVRKL